MMHFKGFEEFLEDFVFSLLSTLNIRMLAGIILAFDVSNSENSIAIIVNFLESLDDKLGSELVHRAYYYSNEFIEINISIAIKIESLEQALNVLFTDIYLEVFNSLFKLVEVEGT